MIEVLGQKGEMDGIKTAIDVGLPFVVQSSEGSTDQ
jgi:hypothetical protein